MPTTERKDLFLYAAVVDAVVHEGVTAFRKKNSQGVWAVRQHFRAQEANSPHRKGVQFIVRKKEDFSREEGLRGFITTSQEALLQEADTFTHWTPNIYRYGTYTDKSRHYIKGHTEDNLQQINTFVVDIDTLQVDLADLVATSIDVLNQVPTFVLQTPHGFQLYFVLADPVFISSANQFKSLKVAKKVSWNLKQAFARKYPQVDVGCNDFGFFRAPNSENIVFENLENRFSYSHLMKWSQNWTANNRTANLQLISKDFMPFEDATKESWYRELIRLTEIKGKQGEYGRNNALFTLALACYGSGKTEDFAYNELDQFNSRLTYPVQQKELERALKSAYSGRYKGANFEHIEGLLQNYFKSDYTMNHSTAIIDPKTGKVQPRFFRKHKKSREERTYSHQEEWETDLETFIQKQLVQQQVTRLVYSQRELAEAAGIPLASLKKLIQSTSRIIKRSEGRGCTAITYWTTAAHLLKQGIQKAIAKKKAQGEQYIHFLSTITDVECTIQQETNMKTFERQWGLERLYKQRNYDEISLFSVMGGG
ncbi:primase C-terminal domain-containing protein [Listeria valentina]|uniref:primase C-terminal domain-containing protein n=1 Tax=Listeria valentina TaxID=2705293 RepID=UPI001430FE9B|nr:primase C-terminal domain-containing protein [Listeria valentina]